MAETFKTGCQLTETVLFMHKNQYFILIICLFPVFMTENTAYLKVNVYTSAIFYSDRSLLTCTR